MNIYLYKTFLPCQKRPIKHAILSTSLTSFNHELYLGDIINQLHSELTSDILQHLGHHILR